MKAVREAVEGARLAGVEILTLFAFSTENWQRPAIEVSALMSLLKHYAEQEQKELRAKGVEVRVLGELDRIDGAARAAVDRIVQATAGGQHLRLNLMISYGGREELLRAFRDIAEKLAEGVLKLEDVNEECVESHLFTSGLPDPDLLIRTSGELRLSNFMLWQLAYTEIHTTAVLWPDFTRDDFAGAVREYQRRDRRFGRVNAG